MPIDDDEPLTICQVLEERTSRTLTIKVDWRKTSFDLTIFDSNDAYFGTMSEEDILRTIRQLGTLTIDEYIKECRAALSSVDGHEDFIYTIDNNTFQWKKLQSNMRIKFGSTALTEVSAFETLYNMLNVLIATNRQLEENLSQLKDKKTVLENSNKDMLQQIDMYLQLKSDTEAELFNQFLVVLNTKKKKISQLQRLLKANKIDVSNVTNEEEEDASNTMIDLYECDTEVESDNDDTDNEEIAEKLTISSPGAIKEKSILFDSDSEPEEKTCIIPKRNVKILPVDGEVARKLNVSNDNVFKANNRRKTPIKRGTRNNKLDDEAGPSGIKISKVGGLNTITENDLEKSKTMRVSETSQINHDCDSSTECDTSTIQNNKVIDDNIKNTNIEEQENVENKSVADILAGLL